MAFPFLDTNIVLRHLLQDVPEQSPRCTAYLARIERGELKVRTADTVVFEVVFTLQRAYKQPKAAIAAAVLPLIELPGIVLPNKRRYRRVFELYVQHNIAFADAYHAVLMHSLKLTEILTYDREFDRISTLVRVEP